MKNAFINAMLLGFVIISSILVFVATVADDLVVQNKIIKLKEITDNAALAMGKHYKINGSTIDAEAISDGLLDQTDLGKEVTSTIVYTWDFVSEPNNVKATIPLYNQSTFWYKFLDKDSFSIENIESKANIIYQTPLNPTTSSLSPLAINNCQDDGAGGTQPRDDSFFLPIYPTFDVVFKTPSMYEDTDTAGVYAVDPTCEYPGGDSNFAHFKGLFGQGEIETVEYDMYNTPDACLVQTSFQNPLTVDPMQLYNQLKAFDLPYQMDVLMFECGTTAVDLDIVGVLSVQLTAVDLVKNVIIQPSGENTNQLTMTFTVVSPDISVELEY